MAFLVPDNLGSRKDVSDAIRRVARAFQTGLEEDSTAWYEPPFDPLNERPHFVVLEPRVGVVVVEVLKGKQPSLLGVVRGRLKVEIDGHEQEVDSPLERAERFAGLLGEKLADHPLVSGVPVGAVAVFSGIDRDEARSKRVDRVLDLDRCIFKPDLDRALNDGNGDGLLRVFGRSLTGAPLDSELSDWQVNELRAVIHPDVVIRTTPEQGSLFSAGNLDPDLVRVMDLKQESMAKGLGTGHRVIRGVAGSGKTLVLVARARLLGRILPNRKILLTCYTRALASQLRKQLAEFPNVQVINLDRLMNQVITDAGMTNPGYDNGSIPVARVALEALRATGNLKYRAVMIDEAQDFDTEALQFCAELLEATDPDEQDLVIVADSAQNIFRKDFRWKDAGIRAQGRTRILRVNYRNTLQILEFAHAFLMQDASLQIDEAPDADDPLTIIPAESAAREGSEPTVTVAEDARGEIRAVVERVRSALTDRTTSRAIAVLYGDTSPGELSRGDPLHRALNEARVPHFWVTDHNQRKNRDLAGSADEPVIVSTIRSAKGLEFPHVIVCGLGVRDDETTARKLLYVGFTRAVNQLDVVTNRGSPFARSLAPGGRAGSGR